MYTNFFEKVTFSYPLKRTRTWNSLVFGLVYVVGAAGKIIANSKLILFLCCWNFGQEQVAMFYVLCLPCNKL